MNFSLKLQHLATSKSKVIGRSVWNDWIISEEGTITSPVQKIGLKKNKHPCYFLHERFVFKSTTSNLRCHCKFKYGCFTKTAVSKMFSLCLITMPLNVKSTERDFCGSWSRVLLHWQKHDPSSSANDSVWNQWKQSGMMSHVRWKRNLTLWMSQTVLKFNGNKDFSIQKTYKRVEFGPTWTILRRHFQDEASLWVRLIPVCNLSMENVRLLIECGFYNRVRLSYTTLFNKGLFGDETICSLLFITTLQLFRPR